MSRFSRDGEVDLRGFAGKIVGGNSSGVMNGVFSGLSSGIGWAVFDPTYPPLKTGEEAL